ncbi:type IV pilus biogenesis/stability protein PilW [Lamprobacter modestohalophilus]|uniref:type IV pilus biogenesis/stability protein PilW n=1 Tax=Lamprobacter modestohalophilus TaxID=1064514 RepID=UPI002ADEE212|nr:type IV pilus biogenesis/stability protein PilW [Lamprobacter modestohalophilus]MEA1051058.1 type IV pilus biogenesis/stability protein PilW [Lamprobacter modestohalophilus]
MQPTTRRWSAFVPTLIALALSLAGCAGSAEKRSNVPEGESPADLYVDLATEYIQRGQLDTALARAQQAVAADRKSPRARYILAIVYERLGDRKQAQREFAEAVERAPKNPDYRNAWGAVLCADGQYDAGLREIQTALADPLYQGPEVALMNAADCSRRAGRRGDGERYLRQALERNPNFAPALLELSKLAYQRGDYQSARSLMTRYSRTGEVSPEALLLAARIERQLGNATLARTLEQALRNRYPHSPEVIEL